MMMYAANAIFPVHRVVYFRIRYLNNDFVIGTNFTDIQSLPEDRMYADVP